MYSERKLRLSETSRWKILTLLAFLAWRSSMDVYEGKMKVLIQVTKYVNHVEQNEMESSEEESSEEDDDM